MFEISEKESIGNFSVFREARDYYADLGFQIALDDTGVAYGSLEAVMELSPRLHQGRSCRSCAASTPIRRARSCCAHSTRWRPRSTLQIIAEGIETSDELATLQRLGIPHGQGYLFGRPAHRCAASH